MRHLIYLLGDPCCGVKAEAAIFKKTNADLLTGTSYIWLKTPGTPLTDSASD